MIKLDVSMVESIAHVSNAHRIVKMHCDRSGQDNKV